MIVGLVLEEADRGDNHGRSENTITKACVQKPFVLVRNQECAYWFHGLVLTLCF
jgi:hypothetical protein